MKWPCIFTGHAPGKWELERSINYTNAKGTIPLGHLTVYTAVCTKCGDLLIRKIKTGETW